MKCLILTVLLSIVQASAPVPRKAANSAGQNTQHNEKNTANNQHQISSTTPSRNPSQRSVSNQQPSNNPASPNAEQTVRVREFPSVSVLRDWADWILWAASGILAVVSILGICVAIQTLRALKIQAIIMRRQTKHIARQALIMRRQTTFIRKSADAAAKSAEVARENIDLIINKERARLRVDLKPLNLNKEALFTVDFTVTTWGATPAYILESRCVTYITPENLIDESDLGSAVMFEIYNFPKVIAASSTPLERFAFLFLDTEKKPMISEIRTGKLFVGVRGFIKYRDVFDAEHATRFRYVWRLNPALGMDERFGEWTKSGRNNENEET